LKYQDENQSNFKMNNQQILRMDEKLHNKIWQLSGKKYQNDIKTN